MRGSTQSLRGLFPRGNEPLATERGLSNLKPQKRRATLSGGTGNVVVRTPREMEMFQESGEEMAGHRGKEMEGESGNRRGLIDALSRHCEILRRETAFLRMETMFLRRSRKDKEKSAHRRIAQKGDMSDQESIGLSNSYCSHDTQMGSRKAKPASRFKSNYHEKELVNCFDFILHETEDLGNRLEAVANILNEAGIPISLYKITELAGIVFRLMQISRGILGGHPAKMAINDDDDDDEEEEVVEEETKYTKSVSNMESHFAHRRVGWESIWGSRMGRCGGFRDATTLSPMHFTHCTPGRNPDTFVTGSTLQIYCIKIKIDVTNDNLNWPLYVYGVVAARDTVDRNRNRLFCRSRDNCQKLTAADPFLHLTGPSRAIVALDPVDFEIELKIKDGANSVTKRDRALIFGINHYTCCGGHAGLCTASFCNSFCTAELSLERIATTVQATILGVCVAEGAWHFKYGCQVACSLSPEEVMVTDSQDTSRHVVLLNFHGEEMPVGSDGYLHLSRHVVSVDLQKRLKVVIQAYSQSGDVSAQDCVYFNPKKCNISEGTIWIAGSKVEITIAWSCLVLSKKDILIEGYV